MPLLFALRSAFIRLRELDALPGSFDESAFVRAAVGVGNVCERAAVYEGGRLLIRKTAVDGVTRGGGGRRNGVFCMNKLYVVGIGAGNYEGMTVRRSAGARACRGDCRVHGLLCARSAVFSG